MTLNFEGRLQISDDNLQKNSVILRPPRDLAVPPRFKKVLIVNKKSPDHESGPQISVVPSAAYAHSEAGYTPLSTSSVTLFFTSGASSL